MNTSSLISIAIKFLSKKEYSRYQLFCKLQKLNYEDSDINRILDKLENNNLLSSDRFATNLVNRKKIKYGNLRIIKELFDSGINSDKIAQIKIELESDEYERAICVLNKRFMCKPKDKLEFSKQVRFMLSRGFSSSIIFKIIKL